MPQTSSVLTAGVTVSAVTLEPFVIWAIHGFPKEAVPENVPFLIAAALVSVGHAAYNLIRARLRAKGIDIEPGQPAE